MTLALTSSLSHTHTSSPSLRCVVSCRVWLAYHGRDSSRKEKERKGLRSGQKDRNYSSFFLTLSPRSVYTCAAAGQCCACRGAETRRPSQLNPHLSAARLHKPACEKNKNKYSCKKAHCDDDWVHGCPSLASSFFLSLKLPPKKN